MGKFGVRDIFDLKVYNKDGLCMIIDTAMSTRLDLRDGQNVLIVEDALVDSDLLQDVLSGKYQTQNLRITGKTSFRDLEHKDHDVKLTITVAKLKAYSLPLGMQPSIATLEFSFPTLDGYGFVNANLEVKDA